MILAQNEERDDALVRSEARVEEVLG
jgi:hypothetical protein